MLELLIEYMRAAVAATIPSAKVSGLAERIEREGRIFPALYCTKDEYKQPMQNEAYAYFRQLRPMTESQSDEESVSGCDEFIVRTYPLTLVAYLPKNILESDDKYIDSKLVNNLSNVLTRLNWGTVISAAKVDFIRAQVRTAETDRYTVWRREYSGIDMVARFDHALIAIDFDVQVQATESCLRNFACGEDVVIPKLCEDVNYELKNTQGDVLSGGSIAAGKTLNLVAPDSVVENSTQTYTQSVPSNGLLVLPNPIIDVNGNPIGSIVSQESVSVNLSDGTNPITPDAVTLVGNTLNIELLDWVRPSDWLPMPPVVDTDDTFVGLYAVFPSGNNFAAFRFTTSAGDYQVDWGDGTIDVVASGVTAEHTYDYSTYDPSNSTLTTRGYKQAMITVTPVSGLLTTCDFQQRRTTVPAQNQSYATGFLDCILSMPNANLGLSIVFGGVTVRHSYVERFHALTIGGATNTTSMFNGCFSLQSVPTFDTSAVTNMNGMFNGCRSLQSVPTFDTSAVTNMLAMFYECASLKLVPTFDTSAVTNMTSMFNRCASLQSVPAFDTSAVTNMNSMFFGCRSLQSVPAFDTSAVTNMTSMFFQCSSLNYIPALDTSAINSDFTNDFALDCLSLDRCDMIFQFNVGFANCQLSRTELVNIFTNLAVVVGKTITITGNWGASALTLADRDIAILKGWTIVG